MGKSNLTSRIKQLSFKKQGGNDMLVSITPIYNYTLVEVRGDFILIISRNLVAGIEEQVYETFNDAEKAANTHWQETLTPYLDLSI